jgi:hypothetical protein
MKTQPNCRIIQFTPYKSQVLLRYTPYRMNMSV